MGSSAVLLNKYRRSCGVCGVERYYLKVKGDASHPCHGAVDFDTANCIYGESYVRRISGFLLAYRLQQNISELQFLCPQEIADPGAIRHLGYYLKLICICSSMVLRDKYQNVM